MILEPDYHSLSESPQLIADNFVEIRKHFPKTAEAAEAAHQAFQQLLKQHLNADRQIFETVIRTVLVFGAHSAWVDCCIDSASGHLASAFSNLRRSIELVCYAAKIKNSEQRALDWLNQRNDKAARKSFSRECSIPLCYESEKYKVLWALILAHDVSNYYGSHGDIEALCYSMNELTQKLDEKKLVYIYQADLKDSVVTFGYAAERKSHFGCIEGDHG